MYILIADDHIGVRSAIARVLREEIQNLELTEATNLGELFAVSFQQQPHLILLDWELSGLPSAAIISLGMDDPKRRRGELRRNVVLLSLHSLSSHPFVVVLSSHPEARRAALNGGADAFVLKGGAPFELFNILHSILKTRK